MQAIVLASYGGPEVLTLSDVETPEPAPQEVRLNVAYAGVNRPDILQREGRYPPPPGSQPHLGLEASGVIDKLGGDDCHDALGQRLSVGDRVTALCNGGGYAEQVVVTARHCWLVPDEVSLARAAGIPETFLTVWHNVFMQCQVRPKERVLIHGGSSGIGTAAIALLRHHGAETIVTCGTADKCQACLELGATHAFLYTEQDWAVKIRTQLGRVDVVLDMIGGDYIMPNLELLAEGGRCAMIAFQKGPKAAMDFSALLRRQLTLRGSRLRFLSPTQKDALCHHFWTHNAPAIVQGQVSPTICRMFPLAEAAQAHQLLEAKAVVGKLVLTVNAALDTARA